MKLRRILFWCHLITGVVAGSIIFVMCVTGILLAYQPQILRFLDRKARLVDPPARAARLSPAALFAKAQQARPGAHLLSLTLQSDPSEAAAFQLEGPGGPGSSPVLYVNPYTGAIQGEGSLAARAFFRKMTDWHRWLGFSGQTRDAARAATGFCNAAFLFLAISGIYIWWPRKWTPEALKAAALLNVRLSGRARDWNWHNGAGIWCALILVVLTATGMVLSYSWANDLVYRLTGSEVPGRQAPPTSFAPPSHERTGAFDVPRGGEHARGPRVPPNLDDLWATAESKVPNWQSISLRIPARAGLVTFAISNGKSWDLTARSQLTVNAATGEIVSWERYSDQSLGRRVRTWIRFLHTGEALGPVGQTLAGAASAGGALLVFTGLSLALRRLSAWFRKRGAILSVAHSQPPGTAASARRVF